MRSIISCLFIFLFINSIVKSQNTKTLEVDSQITISPLLYEISGMCLHNGDIYAINDSGNGSVIYKLDPETGKMIEYYRIRNIRNRDWEELSVFQGKLYIGDFGNNSGKRKDLVIYSISIDSIQYPEPPVATTQIKYSTEQESKVRRSTNEWDCEAMTVTSEGIYCFSKNRKDLITKMYHLKEGNKDLLCPVDSFNTGFLVTGAFYYNYGKSLFLCGYYKDETYLLHFRNTTEVKFSEEYTRYVLPELKSTQVESVFVSGNYIYLASERTTKQQAIYRVRLKDLE